MQHLSNLPSPYEDEHTSKCCIIVSKWMHCSLIPTLLFLMPLSLHSKATSNRVPCEAHGTYPLNPMGDNVIDGKFVCPMIEGNHHGTNQSEMHQTGEFVSSHNCPCQSKGQFQFFNNENIIVLFQNMMAPTLDSIFTLTMNNISLWA